MMEIISAIDNVVQFDQPTELWSPTEHSLNQSAADHSSCFITLLDNSIQLSHTCELLSFVTSNDLL